MQPIVTDRAEYVWWSVTVVSPAKSAELKEMSFGLRTSIRWEFPLHPRWEEAREKRGSPL